MSEPVSDKPLRTFGRRVGQGLSPRQKELVAKSLSAFTPPLKSDAHAYIKALQARGFEQIVLEIGFGGGEHLAHNARLYPKTFFIGAEPFLNGVVKLLDVAVAEKLDNIAMFRGDVRELLLWLPDNSLARIDMLYPDPWPKKRHHKRRLFNEELLRLAHQKLKPGSVFRFASDIPHYVAWAFEKVEASALFTPLTRDEAALRQPYPGWPGTRYEEKALLEGRVPQYLVFVRCD